MPTEIYPIVLNSNNVDPNDNSRYIYRFPRGSTRLRSASVAISQINLFYSWANINASLYNNHQFQLIVPDGSTLGFTEYTITVPDGNYSIEDLNKFLQNWFISQKMYFTNNSTGQLLFYYEIVANKNLYKVQLIASKLPTSCPAGYTDHGFSYPTIADQQMTMVFLPHNNFNDLLGFDKGQGYFDAVSTKTPQMSPVSSVLVTCSLINNRFSNPNNILFSFVSGSTEFGRMLSIQNQDIQWTNIEDGIYTEVIITFISQDFKRLIIQDNNLIIYLLLKIDE